MTFSDFQWRFQWRCQVQDEIDDVSQHPVHAPHAPLFEAVPGALEDAVVGALMAPRAFGARPLARAARELSSPVGASVLDESAAHHREGLEDLGHKTSLESVARRPFRQLSRQLSK